MFEQSQQLILNIFDFFNMLKTMLKRMYLGKGCSQCQKIVFKDNMFEQIVEIHRQVASDAQKRNMNAINIPKKYLIIVGQHSIRLLKYKESFAQNMNDQLTECKRFQPPVYGCQINERNAAAEKSNHEFSKFKIGFLNNNKRQENKAILQEQIYKIILVFSGHQYRQSYIVNQLNLSNAYILVVLLLALIQDLYKITDDLLIKSIELNIICQVTYQQYPL